MNSGPRVAFFTDSFHEVNGVAHTSRHFDAFARRRALPFLNVHAGSRTELTAEGPVSTLELKRGQIGFSLESDMSFDLLFLKHKRAAADAVREFRADLIHITGPSDVGILGAYLAHDLKLPLVASWHTNLHEFGARRLEKMLRFLPEAARKSIAGIAERDVILSSTVLFYRLSRVILAPNLELVEMLQRRTNRPAFLMQRGVDTTLFCPERRERADGTLRIGYVGRLSPEKGVRLLRDVELALIAAGVSDYRMVIVGDGQERAWLESNLIRAEFTGLLSGEALARAYANLDIFAFPSHTDTFGNVVLEAIASGVPPVVTSGGGPKYLVMEGVTGLVADTPASFLRAMVRLAMDRELRLRMRGKAREFAICRYWHRVFEQVYDVYEYALSHDSRGAKALRRPTVTLGA